LLLPSRIQAVPWLMPEELGCLRSVLFRKLGLEAGFAGKHWVFIARSATSTQRLMDFRMDVPTIEHRLQRLLC